MNKLICIHSWNFFTKPAFVFVRGSVSPDSPLEETDKGKKIDTGLTVTGNVIGAGKITVEGGARAMEKVSLDERTLAARETKASALKYIRERLSITALSGKNLDKVAAPFLVDLENIDDSATEEVKQERYRLLTEFNKALEDAKKGTTAGEAAKNPAQAAGSEGATEKSVTSKASDVREKPEISDARKAELSIRFLRNHGMVGTTIPTIIHPFDETETDSRQAGLFVAKIKEFQKRVCNFAEHDKNDPSLSDGIFGQKTLDLYKEAVNSHNMEDFLGLLTEKKEEPAVEKAPRSENPAVGLDAVSSIRTYATTNIVNFNREIADIDNPKVHDLVKMTKKVGDIPEGAIVQIFEVIGGTGRKQVKVRAVDGHVSEMYLQPGEDFEKPEGEEGKIATARFIDSVGRRLYDLDKKEALAEDKSQYEKREYYAKLPQQTEMSVSGLRTGAKINVGKVEKGGIVAVLNKTADGNFLYVENSQGQKGYIPTETIPADAIAKRTGNEKPLEVIAKLETYKTAVASNPVSTPAPTAATDATGGAAA